jgi:hypothetical protein
MQSSLLDRRSDRREPLYLSRRRFPRLSVACDVFYESPAANLLSSKADLSLRGMFLATRLPDAPGARGTVRLDLGRGALLKAAVVVVSHTGSARNGMALRIVDMSELDRLRYGAFLLRRGGLPVLPQLDRHFATVTRSPRPAGAREAA